MKKTHKMFFFSGIATFWILRIYYWIITFELPFSDMADYDMIAHKVLRSGDFSHSSFFQSYQSPVLPVIRAIQLFIFRSDAMIYWQIFLGICTFASLLWLIFEINKTTHNKLFGILFLWIVALSRSSIFWSYKIATESTSEFLIYLSLASTLAAFRMKNKVAFFATGMISIATALNRPNFIVFIPFFIIVLFVSERKKMKKTVPLLLSFCLGILLVWTPWLLRSYRLYNGGIVPFNTHGPYTFFFDLGDVTIQLNNGTSVTTSFWKLALESPKKFRNDYEFYTYSNLLVKQWLRDNWNRYVGLYLERIPYSIREKTDLTKVSRTSLYLNVLDEILLDKSFAAITLGSVGFLILLFFHPYVFFLFPVVGILSWLNGLIIVHSPRMLEPVIPLILFGNVGWILLFNKIIKRDI